ncbi:hypothetical protein [Paraglaciecola sp. 2405UD69-4]|uniref:hypothetical protein n=1 Tax=Paraglaciecola sp. 2405UD69-4 TaxID=3391836 RepID=UPI0039C92DC8
MKGSAVGFSFLTLFSVIAAVLAHMGIFIGGLLGNDTALNLILISAIFVAVAILNAFIVYGLKRRQNWAVALGVIEMIVLIIATVTNVTLNGFSELFGTCYWLLIASLFLISLRSDYKDFQNRGESHV